VNDRVERESEKSLLDGRPMSRREPLPIAGIAGVAIGVGGGLSACGTSGTTASTSGHVKDATAITRVYGDELKPIAVALEHDDQTTDNAKPSKQAFTVSGRTITSSFATSAAHLTDQGGNGRGGGPHRRRLPTLRSCS
jgi:hypothetical protein